MKKKKNKSNIVTEPDTIASLIRIMQDAINSRERQIIYLRKLNMNYEALIERMRETGAYENPTGRETSKENDEHWRRAIGSKYQPLD